MAEFDEELHERARGLISPSKRRKASEGEIVDIMDTAAEYPMPVKEQMARDLRTYPIFDAMAMWVGRGGLMKHEPYIRALVEKYVNKEEVDLSSYDLGETPFERTCKVMGGEYTSEYGLLEPDVGGDHFEEWEARKEWCTFHDEKLPDGKITVFRAPNVVSVQSELFSPIYGLELDMDVEEKYDPEQRKMCFKQKALKSHGHVKGATHFCIEGYPTEDTSHYWLEFPDWGWFKPPSRIKSDLLDKIADELIEKCSIEEVQFYEALSKAAGFAKGLTWGTKKR